MTKITLYKGTNWTRLGVIALIVGGLTSVNNVAMADDIEPQPSYSLKSVVEEDGTAVATWIVSDEEGTTEVVEEYAMPIVEEQNSTPEVTKEPVATPEVTKEPVATPEVTKELTSEPVKEPLSITTTTVKVPEKAVNKNVKVVEKNENREGDAWQWLDIDTVLEREPERTGRFGGTISAGAYDLGAQRVLISAEVRDVYYLDQRDDTVDYTWLKNADDRPKVANYRENALRSYQIYQLASDGSVIQESMSQHAPVVLTVDEPGNAVFEVTVCELYPNGINWSGEGIGWVGSIAPCETTTVEVEVSK